MEGRDAYKKITAQLKSAKEEHDRVSAEYNGLDRQLADLQSERAGIYAQLSDLYLDELDADAAVQTIPQMQAKVQQIYDAKHERREQLETLMADARARKDALEEQYDTVTEQLRTAGEQRDQVRATIAAELAQDGDYVALDAERDQLMATLGQMQQQYPQLQQLHASALRSYTSNPVFFYLDSLGYGDNDYRPRPGLAGFDSWVAGVINFDDQKKRYGALQVLIEYLANDVADKQAEAAQLELELDRTEDLIESRHGLQQIIQAGSMLETQRDALQREIDAVTNEIGEYMQERRESDSTRGRYFRKAKEELLETLQGASVAQLRRIAREHEGQADDTLVARLDEIDGLIGSLSASAKEKRAERDHAASRVEDIEDLQDNFRNNDYDSSRSYFSDDFDVDELVLGYLAGKYDADHMTRTVRDCHRRRSPPSSTTSYGHRSTARSHRRSYSDYGSDDSGTGLTGWSLPSPTSSRSSRRSSGVGGGSHRSGSRSIGGGSHRSGSSSIGGGAHRSGRRGF